MKKVSIKKLLSVLLSVTLVAGLLTAISWHKAEAAAGVNTITLAGTSNGTTLFNGKDWAQADTSNDLTQVATDIWEITYEGVEPNSFKYKFVVNHSWDWVFGNDTLTVNKSGTSFNAWDDSGDMKLSISTKSNVRFRLDLSAGVKNGMATVWFSPVEEVASNGAATKTVTHNVTNAIYSGVGYRYDGNNYITTLTPYQDYSLPQTIKITSGDVTLVQGTDYTYDKATGEVEIKSSAANGEIVIEAKATSTFPIYVVAGVTALTGIYWEGAYANNDENVMVLGNDGKYTKTYTNVAAGDYTFKVVKHSNSSSSTWIGKDGGNDNVAFTVARDGYDVTITYDPNTNAITFDGEGIGEWKLNSMCVIGSESLFGDDWSVFKSMTKKDGTNIYEYTLTDVAAGTHTYKFAANGGWDANWGKDGVYDNGTNYSVTVPYNGSTVKFTVDLTGVDMSDPSKVKLSSSVTVTPKSYSVTLPTGNITASGSNTATTGTNYTATLSPQNGYGLPETITVTIGGTAYTGYTYNKTTGAVTIPGAAITGNIVISATAVELPDIYTVTFPTDVNITATGDVTVTENTGYTVTLAAKAGYELPSAITVTIDGETVNNFTYDSESGVVTIPAAAVTGDIVISATAVKLPEVYTVTLPSDSTISASGATTATEGVDYTATLKAAEGYVLPDTIIVRIGGEIYDGYTYSPETGVVFIPGEDIKGSIDISATAEVVFDHMSIAGCEELFGKFWTAIAMSKVGNTDVWEYTIENVKAGRYTYKFVMNDSITVANWGTDGKYFGDDIVLEVPYDKCTVTFKVDLTGVDMSKPAEVKLSYTVKTTPISEFNYMSIAGDEGLFSADWSFTTMTKIGDTDVWEFILTDVAAGTYEYKFAANSQWTHSWGVDGWYNGANCSLTVPYDGSTVKFRVDLTDADTFSLTTIRLSSTVTITPKSYTVTLPTDTNIDAAVNATPTAGEDFTVTLTAKTGYKLPEKITVTIGVDAYTGFTYDKATGNVTIPGAAIKGNIVINATAVADTPVVPPTDPTEYEVTLPTDTNLTVTGENKVEEGNDYTVILVAKTGYKLSDEIIVTIGGKAYTSFTFDKATGKITIPAAAVTGNIEIKATAVEEVVVPEENQPVEDDTVITEEDIQDMDAKVENNAEGTELVIAPIVQETFDEVKTLVQDTFQDKIYQMVDIKLVDENGAAVQPEEGKKVSITIKLPEVLKAAKKIAVSRYDEVTKKLVQISTVDATDGKITFATDHFSTYVFADATPASEDAPVVTPPVVTPDKTADMAPIAMVVLVALLAAAVVVLKKREVNE